LPFISTDTDMQTSRSFIFHSPPNSMQLQLTFCGGR
jgi:hypothetical protein